MTNYQCDDTKNLRCIGELHDPDEWYCR